MIYDRFLNYRLCYASSLGGSDSYFELWFTDKYGNVYGDDWNDRPAECNAGEPYFNLGNYYRVIISGYYNTFVSGLEVYSIDDLNEKKAAYLLNDNAAVFGGDTLQEVIDKLSKVEDVKIYYSLDEEKKHEDY